MLLHMWLIHSILYIHKYFTVIKMSFNSVAIPIASPLLVILCFNCWLNLVYSDKSWLSAISTLPPFTQLRWACATPTPPNPAHHHNPTQDGNSTWIPGQQQSLAGLQKKYCKKIKLSTRSKPTSSRLIPKLKLFSFVGIVVDSWGCVLRKPCLDGELAMV